MADFGEQKLLRIFVRGVCHPCFYFSKGHKTDRQRNNSLEKAHTQFHGIKRIWGREMFEGKDPAGAILLLEFWRVSW